MKVLIIGYGSIGKRHAEVLSQIKDVSEIHVVSKQKNINFRTFRTLDEVTDLDDYSYFVIASITSLHLTQLKFIDSKVKGKTILVEKPLSTTCVDVEVNNRVFVAYNLRFHPLIIKLKNLLINERVIDVNIKTGQYLPTWRPGRDYTKTYSASVEDGGGVLLDLSHEIDYLLWLFGDIDSLKSINDKISDLEIESDDFVTVIGRLKSGAVYNLTIDYISKIIMRRIIVNTMNNSYYVDFVNNKLLRADKSGNTEEHVVSSIERNSSYTEMHLQVLGLRSNNFASTLDDGIKVLSVIERIRNNE